MHLYGPTGVNAVEAAIELCETATGRGDIVSFQGGFHGCSHAAIAVSGVVEQKRPSSGVPASTSSRTPHAADARSVCVLTPAKPTASAIWSARR